MDMMTWVIFGLVVGAIANVLDPKPAQGGILGAIILGIVGAMVGGFIGNLVFGVDISGFNLPSFMVAVMGAIGVLFVGRILARDEV